MKKLFGILMALVLALALLPTTVFAAEEVAKIDDGTTFETLEAAVKAAVEYEQDIKVVGGETH